MTSAAIFVKTPGLSPLKTRLACGIGQAAAEQWYLLAAAAVAEAATAAGLAPVYWAIAEKEGESFPGWAGQARLQQGEGNLGQRMARVHSELVRRHGAGFLLGADAPQLDPKCLSAAAKWLDSPEPRLCLGLANDGGFWTFAANLAIDEERWCSAQYSRADTAASFIRALADLGEWQMLPKLTDVDHAADLEDFLVELASLDHPLPLQRRLLQSDE